MRLRYRINHVEAWEKRRYVDRQPPAMALGPQERPGIALDAGPFLFRFRSVRG
jgi:hypothetical protein